MDPATAAALLELAERASAGATGPNAKDSLELLEQRSGDLQEAIAWFVDEGRTDEALRVANALYRFWITKQRFDEGAVWFDRALASPGGDDRLRGKACLNAGFMPFWMGDDERAAELFDQALEIARRLDDPPLISGALGGLSRVALRTDVAEGRRLAAEALAVSEGAADEPGRSNALHLLGVGAQIAGDLAEARDWMTQRLALLRGRRQRVPHRFGSRQPQHGRAPAREPRHGGDAGTRGPADLRAHRRPVRPAVRPRGLAAIAMERGEFERSATLVGAAEAIMEAQHMAWPPDERPHYDHMLADAARGHGLGRIRTGPPLGQSMAGGEALARPRVVGRRGGPGPSGSTD